MRAWTLHLPPAPGPRPLLLREGFSLWAFLLGPLWLLWQRCWLAAALVLLAELALAQLPGAAGLALPLAFQLLVGWHGRDLLRWTRERQGWRLAQVVLAADEERALARLWARAPALREAWR
ncbi:DUF2628 domain-containing protein [Roseococcus sp. DSY-14]|uniref:DUF2628 domain-containing protein n=1 Tax=Roseococcus sp. DSY-14 TaxID=3369650 RepID=UPI00387B9C34